ncbi:hypothetical protein P6F26_03490 [Roseibacterium sp. SDUM158017]|uniref:hypothetical protein n=1 Tax=Roseicyclus salinarum TaxID=3036773 RepID=UPI002414E1FD|nr:hypothetical protein [Roseibacterium sp. SDUM158017]MDG4647496.1 hypothetical protein [Roseibacterium sp. SDUM158017]
MKSLFARPVISVAAVSAIAVAASLAAGVVTAPYPWGVSAAFAQEEGGGGSGGRGAGGPGGSGGGGHDEGDGHDEGGSHEEGGGVGSGGRGGGHDPGGAGDAPGPQAGAAGGEQGHGDGEPRGGSGQPWARDALLPAWSDMDPETFELGRLNVARSPEQVLARAYGEAELVLGGMSGFYNLSLGEMRDLLSDPVRFDQTAFIDSPLQNLALFEDALDGTIDLRDFGITASAGTILAVTLGMASDKEMEISPETVYALSVIFEKPLTQASAASIAAAADAIRAAVLAGHG